MAFFDQFTNGQVTSAMPPGGQTTQSPGGDPAAFIANWQQTHSPTEGKAPLIAALQQAGFNASPYMYGSTESGNEITLNGDRYKVFSGDEGTPGSAWYVPGSEGSGGGSQGGAGGMDFSSVPGGFGSMIAPWTQQFTAPTADQALATPGLQFAMQQGQQAIQNSAAAKGTLLTGGTLKGLDAYGTGMALQGYGDAYNRALGEYSLQKQNFQDNQDRPFNKLGFLSASGQGAANATNAAGTNYGNNSSSLITGAGNSAAAGSIAQGNLMGQLPQTLGAFGSTNLYGQNPYGQNPSQSSYQVKAY